MIIDKKCTCGSKSTGDTTIRCCNLCGLPMPNEPWHFNLDENIFSQVEKPVMPNEVLDGGLTEEEQEFMEMIINWQMENPKAYERIKSFADVAVSRATLFSALADYASQREA